MITRSVAWRSDLDGRNEAVTITLDLVDVGAVAATVRMIPDVGLAELGPLSPDELTDLGAAILDAAEAARRWERDTAR
jgi:hypothetical protein